MKNKLTSYLSNIKFTFNVVISYFLRKSIVLSKYNIKLKANWIDKTFKFYVFANYGYLFANYIIKSNNVKTFIDIGSNQGLYSILAAKNKNIKKIYAIEPNINTYKYLKENILLNNSGEKIEAINKAISQDFKEVELIFNKTHSGKAMINPNTGKEFNTKNKNNEYLKIESVQKEFFNNLNNYSSIFFKIDVEGYEEKVIDIIFANLENSCISGFFIEFSVYRKETSSIIKKLLNKNFLIKNITNSYDGQFDLLFEKKS